MLHVHPNPILLVFVTLVTSAEKYKFCSYATVPFFFGKYFEEYQIYVCIKPPKAKGHFKSKLPESVSTFRRPFSTFKKNHPFSLPFLLNWISNIPFFLPPPPLTPLPDFCGTQLPAKDNFT